MGKNTHVSDGYFGVHRLIVSADDATVADADDDPSACHSVSRLPLDVRLRFQLA